MDIDTQTKFAIGNWVKTKVDIRNMGAFLQIADIYQQEGFKNGEVCVGWGTSSTMQKDRNRLSYVAESEMDTHIVMRCGDRYFLYRDDVGNIRLFDSETKMNTRVVTDFPNQVHLETPVIGKTVFVSYSKISNPANLGTPIFEYVNSFIEHEQSFK